jgi:DNA repair exonuclease SbcCD nuclease subunit
MMLHKEKVACIADIHLGTHQDSPVWHKIALNYAKWLRDDLNKRGIKDIIILGDIFNNRNEISVTTLYILPLFFEILKEFNIIITVGNHDCYYNTRHDVHSIGSLSNWENIHVIDKLTTLTIFNKVLSFCPWETNLKEIIKSDIVFGHFEIQSFKMTYAQVCEYGIKPKDLLEKAPLIISGHFHISESRPYTEGNILYLGCPYELNWGDYGSQKGYYILDVPTSKYEFIENNISPKHKKLNFSELTAGGITETIKKDFLGNIVRISFDIPIDEEESNKLLDKLMVLKPLDLKFEYFQEGIKIDNNDLTTFEGVDINGSLIEYIKRMEGIEYKDEVTKYVLDVYSRVKTKNQEVVIDEE